MLVMRKATVRHLAYATSDIAGWPKVSLTRTIRNGDEVRSRTYARDPDDSR